LTKFLPNVAICDLLDLRLGEPVRTGHPLAEADLALMLAQGVQHLPRCVAERVDGDAVRILEEETDDGDELARRGLELRDLHGAGRVLT
jgi:hypothetical protein